MSSSVSVVVVNRDGEAFLERCLSALMAQTVTPHEVIVVDNASSDGSIGIARRFPSVKLLALDQNVGFARGNNLAIEAASAESEWIALVNPDAFLAPTWLEELLKAARQNPRYGMFASKLINAVDRGVLDGAGDAYHMSGLVWRTGHGRPATEVADVEREVFYPCAAAALYRRSTLVAVGGFDEAYFCYHEDADLGFRLRLAGHRCLYVPSAEAYHVGGGTTGGRRSDFRIYHGHRNLVWSFVKNMPGALFWLLLPLHLVLNLVEVAVATFRGQGRVSLRAKKDAVLGLTRIWGYRREVQAARVASLAQIWKALNKQPFPIRR